MDHNDPAVRQSVQSALNGFGARFAAAHNGFRYADVERGKGRLVRFVSDKHKRFAAALHQKRRRTLDGSAAAKRRQQLIKAHARCAARAKQNSGDHPSSTV